MIQNHNDGADDGAGYGGSEIVCPVCLETVFGDPEVTEAHVDACLVHVTSRPHEQTEVGIGGPSRTRATDCVNLAGLIPPKNISKFSGVQVSVVASGFHVRDTNHKDVEGEIDVDGDDEDIFGRAQFTEVDILSASKSMNSSGGSEATVEIEETSEPLVKRPLSYPQPVSSPSPSSRLANNVQEQSTPPPTCRICLDPYAEPTISTQCWHACCRKCWLRCLESRLCPICKRITTASDLRRIYL